MDRQAGIRRIRGEQPSGAGPKVEREKIAVSKVNRFRFRFVVKIGLKRIRLWN